MNRMKSFSVVNPTGETPGMEPIRLDVLQAAVKNAPPDAPTCPDVPPPQPQAAPVPTSAAPVVHLVTKTIRLPSDLVDFIDYVYTKEKRLKKQDAYTQALDSYFRPLMKADAEAQ